MDDVATGIVQIMNKQSGEEAECEKGNAHTGRYQTVSTFTKEEISRECTNISRY